MAPCWLCGQEHRQPKEIYRCLQCGQAICWAELYQGEELSRPYAHRKDGKPCGEAKRIGRALGLF